MFHDYSLLYYNNVYSVYYMFVNILYIYSKSIKFEVFNNVNV